VGRIVKIATYNVNGVNGRLPRLAEWLRETAPDVVCLQEIKTSDPRFPVDASDGQSRYLEADVDGIVVASIYLPNGNPQPGPKFDYKLAWFERLIAHAGTLVDAGAPVVLAGDFNVVPTDADIYNAWLWRWDAVMQPQTDSTRRLHPSSPTAGPAGVDGIAARAHTMTLS
jgi:exodeoxyribonuclease-3